MRQYREKCFSSFEMSTASSDKPSQVSTMSNTLLDKFNGECNEYLNSELNTRLLSTDKLSISAASEYYLTEYQRCIDDQMNFVNYIDEQMSSLDALKSCEIAIDTFLERLKSIHEYELKQNDIFEQILHELTKMVRKIFLLFQK
jgi:hypothetical protein